MFRNWEAKPLIATLMFCAVSATGAAMDRGQFNNVPPQIREWFEHMRSPKGIMCCNYADGHRTGYDIRQGQYWVPIEGEWYPVPPEAVIKTENPVGEAIVWYLHKGPEADLPRGEWYRIICFVPSGDVKFPSSPRQGPDPQTLVLIEKAFDEAWLMLKSVGNKSVKPDELARSVLRLAMEGERDPARLHDGALERLLPATNWREGELIA